MYVIPADDRPRMIEWEAGTDLNDVPAVLSWWHPAVVDYGGRASQVILDSKGEMFVFTGNTLAGQAPAPYQAKGPTHPHFWPLGDSVLEYGASAPAISHNIRDTGCMLACVDGEYGLAVLESQRWEQQRWEIASACTLLKVYPPLALGFEGVAVEFEDGVQALGERAARRVKRALVDRLAAERRTMRTLSDRIEAHWR